MDTQYWRRHEKRRQELPYMVAIHGPTRRVAVYNRHYQLIGEEAPAALIYRARRHHRARREGFNLTYPWQWPTWLVDERMRDETVCLFLYDDGDVNNGEWLAAIPGATRISVHA